MFNIMRRTCLINKHNYFFLEKQLDAVMHSKAGDIFFEQRKAQTDPKKIHGRGIDCENASLFNEIFSCHFVSFRCKKNLSPDPAPCPFKVVRVR